MKRIYLLTLGVSFMLSGCGAPALAAPATQTSVPSATATQRPPTATAGIILSSTASATLTPSPMPTPTWVNQGPDAVTVPILMYHHIGISPIGSRYYLTPDKFEEQMRLLQAWEYTPITTSMLVDAILEGTSLPPHPVILTFDDANEDNYTTAFPIMQKYGMTGVLYIPYNFIGADGFLSVEQITEMAAAGWEVGSHSLSHPDLTRDISPERLRTEIVDSRRKLEDLLGLPILTFAYPFGDVNGAVVDYVKFAGYIAAVGATGYTADQGLNNLYDLQREEIKGSEDAKTFIRFLPWHGDPSFLPTDTPTPTPKPTRTPVPTYTQYPTKTPKPSPTPVP